MWENKSRKSYLKEKGFFRETCCLLTKLSHLVWLWDFGLFSVVLPGGVNEGGAWQGGKNKPAQQEKSCWAGALIPSRTK